MRLVKQNLESDKYYPFVIKNIGDDFFYYNITTNAVFQMDDDAYALLVDDQNPEDFANTDTIRFFEDNYIIKTSENIAKLEEIYSKVVKNKKSLNAKSLTLMISQECNLRCTYCYGEDGEYSNKGKMNFETARKAIDFFAGQSPSDKLSICFFGGEPLLNFELMKKVIAYVKNIEEKAGKTYTFSMTTNGTLINQEISDFIEENKISLIISIDGNKEMTDANRFYGNKKGAYEVIKKNITNLNTYMIARATMAPPNLAVSESVNHLVDEFGFESVAWAEADNLLAEKDYEYIKDSTFALIDYMEELIKDKQYKKVTKYHSFLDLLRNFDSDGIRSKGCGAGSNMMAVDINGKIYPCHRFVGIEASIIGNVYSKGIENEDFYSNVDLNNFEKCQLCIAKSICGGGCINENYYASGNITEPSEKSCTFKIEIVNRVLDVYIQLNEEDKRQLFNKGK